MQTLAALVALCPGSGTPAQAAALATQLGDDPQAGRLAVTYLTAGARTFTGYRIELLLRRTPQLDTAIELALERLDDEGLGQAHTLLRLLALLPDSSVPYRWFVKSDRLADSELFPRLTGPHLDALLDGLSALALIDTTADLLTMDPAIREFADRDNRDSGQRPAHLALLATLVCAAAPAAELADTAVHVLQLVDDADVDLMANTCLLIGEILAGQDRYDEARTISAAVVARTRRVLGASHPRTLFGLTFLAGWTGNAGDPAAAHDILAEVTDTYRQIAGRDDPDVLVAFSNRAYWAEKSGDAVAARDAFTDLVLIRTGQSGPDDPDVLYDCGALAQWTGMAGDAARAHALFRELLPDFERIWGPDAPDVVAMREAITRWGA
ncbi:tetratricopeptide repeat protein [Actinoplanes sp. HUAS TT8]|uniref:tetratricopeptide repeat protein n=1 Tax=Actinoplanes sp. HUAS TT8 TaxID=3447453 RepID=UPI003F52822A